MDKGEDNADAKQIESGGLRPTGRLAAKGTRPVEGADESGALKERAEIMKTSAGRTIGIRVADDTDTDITADVLDDGSVDLELSGKVAQGEATVPRVCQVLLQHLNQRGAQWSPTRSAAPADARNERGVDCEATDGSAHLLIQVVRAESHPSLWRALRRIGRIRGHWTPSELSDGLHRTIAKKTVRIPLAQRRTIVLALDATHTVGHAQPQVVETFRAEYGVWLSRLEYAGVWVVGIDPALTFRLDDGES